MKALQGLIVKALGGFYYVETSERTYECRAKGIFRKQGISPLVGDQVTIELDGQGKGTVSEIHDRKNEIIRPPLANLDRLFIVTSILEPLPNALIMDKFIAMSEHKGIDPVIIVTKTDLADPAAFIQIYRHAGFRVLSVSSQDDFCQKNSVKEEIMELLRGKLSAFTGNSGVGKSTFLNLICPELHLKTSDISQKLGRGRHTTRHVELFPIREIDAYVADTPGFSSMDLLRYDLIVKDQLQYCFREFEPYLSQCRFTGCSHTVEKGCAVLKALEEGKIEQSRHESYVEMYREVKDLKDWQLPQTGGRKAGR